MFNISTITPQGEPKTFEAMDEDAARREVALLRDQGHRVVSVANAESSREIDEDTFMNPPVATDGP